MATDNYIARVGTAATAGTANWATRPARKGLTGWLPPRNTPMAPGLPPMGREYRMALETLFQRIGGILDASVPEVAGSVSLVQTAVLEAQAAATAAQAVASANTLSIDAIREVAINNNLDGSENIP